MKSILTTCLLISLTLGLRAQQGQWETIPPMAFTSHVAALDDAVLAGTSGAGLVYWDMLDARIHINTSNSAIPGDTISRVAIAPNGHWWVKSEAGIGQFDGANWINWSLETIGLPPGTPVNNIRVGPDASVYVLTEDGFASYSSGAWTVQNMANSDLPNNQLTDVAFGADGKVFFGSRGSGILLLDDGNWTVYNSAATGITNMSLIVGLTFAPDGTLWAVGGPNPNLTVRLISFADNTWTGFAPADIGITVGGAASLYRAIVADPVDGIWLMYRTGLSRLQAGNWTHYPQENIGCSPGFNNFSITLDGTRSVWFISNCGLLRSNGQAWNYMDTGLPGYCGGYKFEGVAKGADSSLWLATTESNGCITRTDGVHWEHYNPLELGASNLNVNAIFTDRQGRTWFGMDNSELLLYDQGQWTLLDTCAAVFPAHWIRTITDSPGGDIWLAMDPLPGSSQPFAGVARYSNGAWSFWTSMEVPNLLGFIWALESNEDGVLWASVSGKGLLRFDGTAWTLFDTSNSGLPSNDVFDITTAADGTLWLATNAGLVSYDGQQWTVTNTANSDLPSDRLRKLAFDHTGGLYAGYLPSAAGHVTAVLRDGQWTEISPPSAPAFSSFYAISAMIVDSRNRMVFTVPNYTYDFYIYDPMIMVNATDIPAKQHNDWSVFPNPGADAFYLRSSALPHDQGYVSLYDLHGRQLMRVPLQEASTPYQMGGLPAGMYVIEVAVSGERPEYLRWVRH
jgi:ligand-binding sensor domain-containing protein